MLFKHSRNRLEALSDGVFGFAATLMVVDIGNSSSFLSIKEVPNFISFAASFFIMMALWKVHYNFFRRTKYVDNWIIALNMVFLFTVLFYIFPVKSLLDTALKQLRMSIDDFSNLFQIYSLGFVLMFGTFSLMYLRAYKKDNKVENPYRLLFYTRHFSLFVIVGLISMLMARLKLGLTFGAPGFVYALLGPLCYFHSVMFTQKHSLD